MDQLKLGTLLSYLQMVLSVVIGIVYTPVMIRLLGQNEYGLYNTVASTISMLSVLSLGFNSGYIRYYARYKKEKKNGSSLQAEWNVFIDFQPDRHNCFFVRNVSYESSSACFFKGADIRGIWNCESLNAAVDDQSGGILSDERFSDDHFRS